MNKAKEIPAGASRRTIIQGAAWSIPVLAMTAAAPASAANSGPCVAGSHTEVLPSTTSSSGHTTNFTVPAGVSELRVTVLGGGGGGTDGTGNYDIRGGNGASVTAIVPVAPSEVLTLVVGQGGGTRATISTTNLVIAGGGGYGDGGNADPSVDLDAGLPASGRNWWGGGSGGGGSAILRGTEPLVVAGGGGGAGGLYGSNWAYYNGGIGGDAGMPGEVNWMQDGDGVGRIDIPGGLVGGGAAGSGTITPGLSLAETYPGLATDPSTPRNGAVGGGAWLSLGSTRYISGAGAGGGGYLGGGSGARAVGVATGGGSSGGIAFGAGGAGGTSYLSAADGVTGTTSTWEHTFTSSTRPGGKIIIEWC